MKIARIAVASLALVASAAHAAPEAIIEFTAPTKYTDNTDIAPGTVISYRVLQGLKGAAKVKVADINGSPTTITTGLVAGNEYCFQVTAVVAGQESAPSVEKCKFMALPIPQAVVITVR